MAGGVCSFRTNPQRALFSTSSRKTKVRPPYILQQWKGYLCKLLNWFTSYPQFSEFLVFPSTVQSLFIHCSCCSLMGFLHAWPVLLPPKFSSLVAFLLLTFFFFWLHSLPELCLQFSCWSFLSLKSPVCSTEGLPNCLLPHVASFPSFHSFFLSPLLTIHPSSGLLLEKFWYRAFKKRMSGRKEKSLFPFQTDLIIHVAYLLSLCSCLSFLHVFWKCRLYPISDPVVCCFFKIFYEAMNLKQFDYRVRKGRTAMHVLWTWSWSFPVHWSSHK